ncbi:hypothetical protein C8R46DRAFT_1037955 [Mycena filopes]|nr:hypothetical protein C8R46DRAFT_1037955 [Mycena filopes]
MAREISTPTMVGPCGYFAGALDDPEYSTSNPSTKFGFCGATIELRRSHHPVLRHEPATALTRRIGYYEARACMSYVPEKISAETINSAFALISSSFNVVEMTKGDSDLWKRTTALKSRNPTLQVQPPMERKTFSDPPTQKIFSALVSSTANTKTFISSLLKVLETYRFDNPAASDQTTQFRQLNDTKYLPAPMHSPAVATRPDIEQTSRVTLAAQVRLAEVETGIILVFLLGSCTNWTLQAVSQ